LGGEEKMNSRNLKGLRCRARREIRTYSGKIAAFSEGMIVSETANLDRRLLRVRWENGVSAYVFPHEVQILNEGFDVNGM
jgi:hypothetical protein